MLEVSLYMLVVPVRYFVYSRGLLVYAGGFSHLYSLTVPVLFIYPGGSLVYPGGFCDLCM